MLIEQPSVNADVTEDVTALEVGGTLRTPGTADTLSHFRTVIGRTPAAINAKPFRMIEYD